MQVEIFERRQIESFQGRPAEDFILQELFNVDLILDLRGELVHVPLAHPVPPVDRQAARFPRQHALHVERQRPPVVLL